MNEVQVTIVFFAFLVFLAAMDAFACTPEINEARLLLNEACDVECAEDVPPPANDASFRCEFWQSYNGGMLDGGWDICNRGYVLRTIDGGERVEIPVKVWFRIR